jgi:chromosome segregation ATPase
MKGDSEVVGLLKKYEEAVAEARKNDEAIVRANEDWLKYREAFDRKLTLLRLERRLLDAAVDNAAELLRSHPQAPSRNMGLNQGTMESPPPY